MKEEPAGWCPGVDGTGKAFELDILLVQLTRQIDQGLDTATQTIQFYTTRVSPSHSMSSALAKPGRSARLTLILSSKSLLQPALISALI